VALIAQFKLPTQLSGLWFYFSRVSGNLLKAGNTVAVENWLIFAARGAKVAGSVVGVRKLEPCLVEA
jgi:hypothetical protein